MAASSSPLTCPDMASGPTRSSTYRSPLTTEPLLDDGVIVTLIVAVCPALMTTGETDADGFTASCHTSPGADETAGSNALVTTDMLTVAVPGAAGVAYGPHSSGPASHRPCVTVPPDGRSEERRVG